MDTNLVLIPVSVTDARNHPVVGIDPHQFRVFDGKVEQDVVNVATDDTPLSVGIVFDGSASMKTKLEKAREAVVEFLKGANPDDEFFLVNFAETAEVAVPFTTSGPEIQSRLMYATTKGKTALLDAIHLALDTMKDARNPRKALLIISDGGDNASRYTKTEIRNATRESDVLIYALGVYGNEPVCCPRKNGAAQGCLRSSPNTREADTSRFSDRRSCLPQRSRLGWNCAISIWWATARRTLGRTESSTRCR
ncbi:MAG: VWA domain-containing protein [Ignavibacteriota bacterium]